MSVAYSVYSGPFVLPMDTYCCTCLSTGRKLFSVTNIPLLSDWLNIEFGLNYSNGFVCWECRAMFMKILRFRAQIVTATLWVGHGVTLSKLGKSVNNVIQCEVEKSEPRFCEIEIKMEHDNVKVKEEPVFAEVEPAFADVEADHQSLNYSSNQNNLDEGCNSNYYKPGDPVHYLQGNKEITCTKIPRVNINESKKVYLEPKPKRKSTGRKVGTLRALPKEKINVEKIKVECSICKKMILIEWLAKHMKLHATDESHPCYVCGQTYRSAREMETHIRDIHKVKPYPCEECKVSFDTIHLYQCHMKTTRKHNNYDFECTTCKKTFLTEQKLQRHVDAIHHRLNLFTCDICGMGYSTKPPLQKHIMKKHENTFKEPPRDKVCDICGDAFTTRAILAVHYLRHTGEKPYKCDVCGTDFRHQSSLYTHNKLVHLKLKRNLKKKAGTKGKSKTKRKDMD